MRASRLSRRAGGFRSRDLGCRRPRDHERAAARRDGRCSKALTRPKLSLHARSTVADHGRAAAATSAPRASTRPPALTRPKLSLHARSTVADHGRAAAATSAPRA